MGRLTDRLLSGTSTSVAGSFQPEQAQFKSLSTPTIEPEAGKETQGFGVSLKAGVPINRQDAIKVLSEETGLPVTRFVIDDEGNIGYKGDDGKYYPAIGSKAGYYAPDILQTGADVGVSLLSSYTGPFSPLVTGIGTTGVEGIRQYAGREVSGSDTSDPFRLLISGGAGFAGELIPTVYRSLKGMDVAKDISQLSKTDMDNILKLADEQGIDITTAEASGLASLLSKQGTVSRLPDTATKLQEYYKKRFGQVYDAVESYLGKISPVSELDEAGRIAQETLIKRREQLKQARFEQTNPIYKQALENASPVDTSSLITKLDDMISTAKGRERQALEKIKKDFYYQKPERVINAKTGRPETQYVEVLDDRPLALQRLKMELDSYINTDEVTGLDSVIQGEIKAINKDLKALIRQDNQLYKDADTLYAKLSEPINEFDRRRAGSSITKISEDNLNSVSKRIFQNADPSSIRYAREQIEAVDPQAWNDVTRAWLQDRWEEALKQSKGAKDVNLDAGLAWRNLLFGDKKTVRSLKAALNEEQYQGLSDLATVLQAAGRVNKYGSDTAFNQETMRQLTSSAQNKIAKLLSPKQSLVDWLNSISLNKNANEFADIILDPKRLNDLKDLKQVPFGSTQFAGGVIQLLLDSGIGFDGRVGSTSDISSEQRKLEREQEKLIDESQPKRKSITDKLLGVK